jgi:propanol-preferring alcohol dehydrogenase
VLTTPQGAVEVRPADISAPGPRELLVRMEACGICHSDLFVAGLQKLPRTPLTLGHEGIGRIEAVGAEVSGYREGERVGITFLGSTCGECVYCTTGRERFCPKQRNTGYTLDGALAGYALADAAHVVRVAENLDAAAVAPLCCAGWTAYGALREAGLGAGASAAIFGYGGLGQLALQYGQAQGLKVAVVDVADGKLERAQAAGAFFTTRSQDSGRSLQKQVGGVDAAIVFTAATEAMEQAIKSVKRTGTVVLVGLTTRDLTLSITETILKGIRIVGSFLGTREDLEAVFRLTAEQGIHPEIESFGLDESPQILAKLNRGEIAGRAVVRF